MKAEVVRELSTPEIKERLAEEKNNLTKLKLNHAISPLDNPRKIGENRKAVARLLTELKKRELAEQLA
ncbi:MAG: 50S ribosomal protein L29 [Bacteroidales bacterium]|jgi:large subunit ribosomal protein L29|nr:50S ribosomal protein L29 [Bacteroidales bacterium]